MRTLKTFNNFVNENIEHEIDYDDVLYSMRDQGWGDISPQWFEDFENSTRYNNETTTDEYIVSFSSYINDVENGTIDEDGNDM